MTMMMIMIMMMIIMMMMIMMMMMMMCDCCEKLQVQFSSFLYSCVGHTSDESLRPCFSQSDKCLLIYGKEKQVKLSLQHSTSFFL